MITRKVVSFAELDKSIGFWETIFGVVHDECTLQDVLSSLCECELHQIYADDTVVGFFTADRQSSKLVEIHAFIYPQFRQHSIDALREMERSWDCSIVTSVWGTHPHAAKILTRMGFVHIETEEDEVRKCGNLYNIDYFYKEKQDGKENSNYYK
ncbi:MAG: hypothetical protein ACRC6V_02225 [Bacteroidales bacterium]